MAVRPRVRSMEAGHGEDPGGSRGSDVGVGFSVRRHCEGPFAYLDDPDMEGFRERGCNKSALRVTV